MQYNEIFDRLWNDYSKQNASAGRVKTLFEKQGDKVVNDHVAFRTFNDSRVDINKIARPFLQAGYVESGQYHFGAKKLNAKHFELPGIPNAPRVFISELLLEEFSPWLQKTIANALDAADSNVFDDEKLIFHGRPWNKISYETYNKLREESEYAAWLYVYGYRANHFTVSVNYLSNIGSIEDVNNLLKESGFTLNTSGGEVKGTKDELLKQSSIMADIIPVEFEEGVYNIPACYYEFAERFKNEDGELYSGFIAKSADKIFESTNFYKK
ncbi:MAG: DUF1338 domain-containing protein [Salinivirgaceae bacterium]|jgi:hypothetical protein|nr:DUF1338 domain-containing protein [Salinivirgaceae bacterium]